MIDKYWCFENPEEAAAEIERLRAALKKIAEYPLRQDAQLDRFGEAIHGTSSYGVEYSAPTIQRMAREALGNQQKAREI